MCSVTTSRPKILRFQKIPAIRTPISLVIASDYECSRPSAVTSVINRYYDPTTDEFLSIDPDVAATDQPYVFTDDDPLNAEDPLGLDPSLGGIESNKQVASVAVALNSSKSKASEATAKALLDYVNTASQLAIRDQTKLSSACAPGTSETNCGTTINDIKTLTANVGNALEAVGPYAVNAVLLAQASIQVAKTLPQWIDSKSVMEDSLGTDMEEEAAVNSLTDTADFGEALSAFWNGVQNFFGDAGGDV